MCLCQFLLKNSFKLTTQGFEARELASSDKLDRWAEAMIIIEAGVACARRVDKIVAVRFVGV